MKETRRRAVVASLVFSVTLSFAQQVPPKAQAEEGAGNRSLP